MTDLVQSKIIEPGASFDGGTGELVPYQPPTTVSLFGTNDPAGVVEAARAAAIPLVDVIRKQKLSVKIGPSEHVRVEGWTLLGSMLGVFPVCVWTRQLMRDDREFGWEARVEAHTRSGEVVGAAESQCTRDENQWSWEPTGKNGQKLSPRDDYALRSMAQTRATSKALRQPLGFVMQLAGFNPTPAEEMPRDEPKKRAAQKTELPGETFEDIFQESHKSGETPTKAAATKLNLLVVELRDAKKITTAQLYHSVGLMRDVDPQDLARAIPDAFDEDDFLHWGPLSKTLSKGEASQLIDRLSKLQAAE
jgi:hypothetical protein